MKRDEYIKEIKEIILGHKINFLTDSSFKFNKNICDIRFDDFRRFYNKVSELEHINNYFEKIKLILNKNYNLLINGLSDKINVSFSPLIEQVKESDEKINQLLSILNTQIKFNTIEEFIKNDKSDFKVCDEFFVSMQTLENNICCLVDKTKKYIVDNVILDVTYKIEYKGHKTGDLNLSLLSKTNDNLCLILNKKYSYDYLDDHSDEAIEMLRTIWDSLYIFFKFLHKLDICSFLENKTNNINNLKKWALDKLISHYKEVDSLFIEGSVFSNLTDEEIRSCLFKIEDKSAYPLQDINADKELSNQKLFADSCNELNSLVGLRAVKETINKIISYIKSAKGKPEFNIHMAFYGNPGTGKTEVARIIGKILFSENVLPSNVFIEASRPDLVSQFVGETAIKTRSLVEKAMGGVLFIDEAYSLTQGNNSVDFGHEAIAELIKQMEDNKGKFCLILAGYKNDMKKMLSTNPGFNSRIQFHLNFENYSRDELFKILKLMLTHYQYSATEEALERMLDITDVMRKDPNFANARTVRNILEQCIMCFSVRNKNPNNNLITLEDVNQYIADAKISLPRKSKDNFAILSADEELNRLIGLDNVKLNIKKIKAFVKKNKDSPNLNLHMAFMGNPGTGKTEVAKIISRILYEIGALPEAKVIIGDRETLVGRYVGETAIKTKEIIEKAMGGVLFIDEAYSLESGGKNDYGSEAVSTMIEEMENNKGKFCVILAGYKDLLKHMIASNPGFDSRIQFYIDFPDYTREELKKIALHFLSMENNSYTIEDGALNCILDICDIFREENKFANARTVRNILQNVIMNQNLRTEIDLNDTNITLKDVNEYIKEKNININKNSENICSLNNRLDIIDEIKKASENYKNQNIDETYYEQAVITIVNGASQGTGFIITETGLCLTCAHCVNGQIDKQQASVTLILNNGQKFKSNFKFSILYKDEVDDFALLKINSDNLIFNYLPVSLDEKLSFKPLSEFIMAGYPFGGDKFRNISITEGKIASINYINGRKVVFSDMFGKPGSSGSPIINKINKKIIGIFWGGITDTNTNEMINCFTPISIVLVKLFK